jgi:hypothetical protein
MRFLFDCLGLGLHGVAYGRERSAYRLCLAIPSQRECTTRPASDQILLDRPWDTALGQPVGASGN